MDIEILVEQIMDAFESEPEIDFGNSNINQTIRQRGVEAHIWDLLQDYTDDLTKILVPESEENA
jgi:hypothetical protein